MCTVAFEAFIEWLYSKDLPETRKGNWIKYGGENVLAGRYIAELNVLVDRLVVDELKGLALELFVNLFNLGFVVVLSGIELAFDNLPEDHPFLQLLVDHHCITYTAEGNITVREWFIRMPREFLFRVLTNYSERKTESHRLKLRTTARTELGLQSC